MKISGEHSRRRVVSFILVLAMLFTPVCTWASREAVSDSITVSDSNETSTTPDTGTDTTEPDSGGDTTDAPDTGTGTDTIEPDSGGDTTGAPDTGTGTDTTEPDSGDTTDAPDTSTGTDTTEPDSGITTKPDTDTGTDTIEPDSGDTTTTPDINTGTDTAKPGTGDTTTAPGTDDTSTPPVSNDKTTPPAVDEGITPPAVEEEETTPPAVEETTPPAVEEVTTPAIEDLGEQAELIKSVNRQIGELKANGVDPLWKLDFVSADGTATQNKSIFDMAWDTYSQLTEESKAFIVEEDRVFLETIFATVTSEDTHCAICFSHEIKAFHVEKNCPYNEENIIRMNEIIALNQAVMEKLAVLEQSRKEAAADGTVTASGSAIKQDEPAILALEQEINEIWESYSAVKADVSDIFVVHGKESEEASIIETYQKLQTAKLEVLALLQVKDPVEALRIMVADFQATTTFVAANQERIAEAWSLLKELYSSDDISDYIQFTFRNWDTASASEAPVISTEWQALVDTYRLYLLESGQYCPDCMDTLGSEIVHIHEAGLSERCPMTPEMSLIDYNPKDERYVGENSVMPAAKGRMARSAYSAAAEEPSPLPALFASALAANGETPVQPSSSISRQEIGGKNGEPLKVYVDTCGRIGVYRDLNGQRTYTQYQYYGGYSNGFMLAFNNRSSLYGTSYLGGTLRDANYNYIATNEVIDGGRTIKTVYVAVNNVQVTQYVNLPSGANYINEWWEIKNYNTQASNNLTFIRGGDTYFSGSDYGKCYYNKGTKSVFVKKDSSSGMMSYIWDSGNPADRYYCGNYSTGRSQAMQGLLSDTAYHNSNPDSSTIDAGYYLQWDKEQIGAGSTWTVRATENFSESGDIQIQAPAESKAAPGSLVSYRYTLSNFSDSAKTVTLSTNSSENYGATIRAGIGGVVKNGSSYSVRVPGSGTATVIVDCEIPASAASGTRDVITLTGTYDGLTRTSSVTTTVQTGLPTIDRVVVTEKNDAAVTVKVVISGLVVGKYVKLDGVLTDENGNEIANSRKTTEPRLVTEDNKNAFVDQLVLPLTGIASANKGNTFYIYINATIVKQDGSADGTVVVPNPNPNDTTTVIPSGPEIKAITKIDLSAPSGTIYKGDKRNLSYTVLPGDATNQTLRWESSDNTVVTVNASGQIEAIASDGTARITAYATDGSNVSASVDVTVVAKPERIELPEEIEIVKGKMADLTAVVYSPNYVLQANQIIWDFSDNNGNITYTGPTNDGNKSTLVLKGEKLTSGEGYVTATAEVSGVTGLKATCRVRVINEKPTGIDITSNGSVVTSLEGEPDGIYNLGGSVAPAAAAEGMTNSQLTWSTTKPDLISFESAGASLGTKIKIAAGKTGTAQVTVRLNNTTIEKTINVTITSSVQSMEIVSQSALMGKGEEQQLAIVYTPVYADNTAVQWSVTQGDATIDNQGLLKVGGSATADQEIKVKAVLNADSSITAGAVFTVEEKLEGLIVSGPAVLQVGETAEYEVQYDPAGISGDNVKNQVEWSHTGEPVAFDSTTAQKVQVTVASTAAIGSTQLKVSSTADGTKGIFGVKAVTITKAGLELLYQDTQGETLTANDAGFYKETVKVSGNGVSQLWGKRNPLVNNVVQGGDTTFHLLSENDLTFTDGSYRLQVYGILANGAVTQEQTVYVRVDSTAPTVALELSGTSVVDGKTGSNTTLGAVATISDGASSSGVQSVEYKVTGTGSTVPEWTAMNSIGENKYQIILSEEFDGKVVVRGTDKAGNTSSEVSKDAMIARSTTAPTIALADSQSAALNSDTWTAKNVTATISKVAGATVTYSTGGAFSTLSGESAVLTFDAEGVYTITAVAKDGAGNVATGTAIVKIDQSAPVVNAVNLTAGAVVTAGDGTSAGSKFVAKSEITVNVSAEDPVIKGLAASGLDKVRYRVTNGADHAVIFDWKDMTSGGSNYTAICNETFDGTIEIKAIDKVGNECVKTMYAALVSVPGAPDANVVTIDYVTETLAYDAKYEVFADQSGSQSIASGAAVTPGSTVYVRVKAVGATPASPFTSVNIPGRPTTPSAVAVKESMAGKNDGKITGVTTAMEWTSGSATGTYQSVTSSQAADGITNLASGDYYVRVKAVAGSAFVSDPQKVTVEAGEACTYTVAVTAPTFTNITYGDQTPASQVITITGKGNSNTTISAVTVSGSDFIISKADGGSEAVTAGGTNTTWSIQPKTTTAGIYNDMITVSYASGAGLETTTAAISFTVDKKAATIQWGSLSFQYDGQPHTVTAEAVGLVAGDTTAEVTVTLEGTASATQAGTYTVTASALAGSKAKNYTMTPETKEWSIAIVRPDAPNASVVAIDYEAETLAYDAKYEVFADQGGSQSIASGVAVTPGSTVYVRVKAVGEIPASTFTAINIAGRPTTPSAVAVKESMSGKNDGKITGVTTAMEWTSGSAAGTYQSVTSSQAADGITNLASGDYYVRVKAVAGSAFVSDSQKVTVEAGEACTYTVAVTAPTFTNITYGDQTPASQVINITGTGNSNTTISAVTVSGSDFIISKADGGSEEVTAGGTNTTWSIQPKTTTAGIYNDTITVSYASGAGLETTTAAISFTVDKKAATIQWGSLSFQYDGQPHAVTAEAVGLVSGDTTAEVTVTLNGKTSAKEVGKYTVTASALAGSKAGNYTMTPETKQWSINSTGTPEFPFEVGTEQELKDAIASGGSILVTGGGIEIDQPITVTTDTSIEIADGVTVTVGGITVGGSNGSGNLTISGGGIITGKPGTGTPGESSDPLISVGNDSSLTINGNVTVSGSGNQTVIDNGNGGTVNVDGNGNVTGSGDQTVIENGNGGTVNVDGNGNVTGSGDQTVIENGNGGTVNVGGDATVSGSGNQTVIDNGNGGTVNVDGNGNVTGSGDQTVINNGNGGTVNVGGNADITGTGNNSVIENASGGSIEVGEHATITGGNGPQGGGIHNAGDLTVKDDATITGGSSQQGGGIHNSGSLTLEGNVTITGNEAATGGGIFNESNGTIEISGKPVIDGNKVTGSGDASNIYLSDGSKIGLTGPLDPDAKIGITVEKPAEKPLVVIGSATDVTNAHQNNNFKADNTEKETIVSNADGLHLEPKSSGGNTGGSGSHGGHGGGSSSSGSNNTSGTPSTDGGSSVVVSTPKTPVNTGANGRNEASVKVSDSDANKAITEAQQKKSDDIIVKPEIVGADGKAVTDAQALDHVSVTISKEAVKNMEEKTNSNLVVDTPLGQVKIPNASLPNVTEPAGDKVSISITKQNSNISIDIMVGETRVEKLKEKAIVTLPVSAMTADSGTGNKVVVIVKLDGTTEVVKKAIVTGNTVLMAVDGSVMVSLQVKEAEFTDMNSHWAKQNAEFVAGRELFKGVGTDNRGNKIFGPNQTMSRGMLVTVLSRLEDDPKAGISKFADIKANAYFAEPVAWAGEVGIISGKNDKFDPDRAISREELAVTLYQYAKYLGMDTTVKSSQRTAVTTFVDGSSVSAWAQDAMNWVVDKKIFAGTSDGKLQPDGAATRAETARTINQFIQVMLS